MHYTLVNAGQPLIVGQAGPSDPDRLLTLAQAAALPELGGVVTVKVLRSAIVAGALAAFQPSGKGGALYTTALSIQSWRAACRVQQSPRDCGSVPPRQPSSPYGSSSTKERKSALDAALKIARELKRS
jgi:hypothetical protein